MSVEPILIALQAAFVALLYLFIWRVVRSAERGLPCCAAGELRDGARAGGPGPGRGGHRPREARGHALDGVPVGTAFEAGPVPTTIGRSGENVIVLDGDDYASARHARVESGLDGTWAIDLGSTNGTYVNGERLQGRRRLHEGDLLQVGDTELRFER